MSSIGGRPPKKTSIQSAPTTRMVMILNHLKYISQTRDVKYGKPSIAWFKFRTRTKFYTKLFNHQRNGMEANWHHDRLINGKFHDSDCSVAFGGRTHSPALQNIKSNVYYAMHSAKRKNRRNRFIHSLNMQWKVKVH